MGIVGLFGFWELSTSQPRFVSLWIVEAYNQLVTFYEVCWLVGILGVKMKEDIVACFFDQTMAIGWTWPPAHPMAIHLT